MLRPEIALARRLRRTISAPEGTLWNVPRRRPGGYRFRRRHPIDSYVADFCCLSKRLAVEVDGSVHDGQRALYDATRDRFIRENGFDVLRMAAGDVMHDTDAVVTAIVARAASPLHHAAHGPPPRAGEDYP